MLVLITPFGRLPLMTRQQPCNCCDTLHPEITNFKLGKFEWALTHPLMSKNWGWGGGQALPMGGGKITCSPESAITFPLTLYGNLNLLVSSMADLGAALVRLFLKSDRAPWSNRSYNSFC